MRSKRSRPLLAGAFFLSTALWAAPAQPAREPRESTCITCHEFEEEEELSRSVPEWRESVHARHEVSCDACHGGDPREEDADLSMSEEAGFLENPAWMEMADYCGVCHESLAARYTSGVFGELLRAGVRVPSCATCHMSEGHRISPSRPDELLSGERCPSCAELENAREALRWLREIRGRERGVGELIGAVAHKGINLRDLMSGMGEVHRVFAEAVHEFDPGVIEAAGLLAATQLSALEEGALASDLRVTRRRRYGVALLVSLGVLLVSLVIFRRTLS